MRKMERRPSKPNLVVPKQISFSVGAEDPTVGFVFGLSLCGANVETLTPAPMGTELVLSVSLPGFDREVRIPGVVRWASATEMGVQFGPLGARETKAILDVAAEQQEHA